MNAQLHQGRFLSVPDQTVPKAGGIKSQQFSWTSVVAQRKSGCPTGPGWWKNHSTTLVFRVQDLERARQPQSGRAGLSRRRRRAGKVYGE